MGEAPPSCQQTASRNSEAHGIDFFRRRAHTSMGWDARGLARSESTPAILQILIRAVDRGAAAQANGVGGSGRRALSTPAVWGSAN